MHIEEKLKRAYEIYKNAFCKIRNMSDSEKKEFESYNISQEQLNIWRDERAIERYNYIISHIDNDKIDYETMETKLCVYLDSITPTKENVIKSVELLELLYEKNIFINLFIPYDRVTSYLTDIIIGELNDESKDYPFYFDEPYGGLIPYLYKNNELDLYNRVLKILYEVLKDRGIILQYLFKYLFDFFKIKKDMVNYKLTEDVLDYSKKK